ncbi:MAG: GNAT family N-acetyltransferase [Oscillospiraceae bacterium]
MIIRKYNSRDCVEIAKLFYDTVHTICLNDYTKAQLDAWATGKVDVVKWNKSFLEHNSIVTIKNNKIIGFADMDKNGYIDRIYVDKNYQRQGVATKMMKYLENTAIKNGVICFETFASITAKPFFEKFGYVVLYENIVIREGQYLKNYKMKKIININNDN